MKSLVCLFTAILFLSSLNLHAQIKIKVLLKEFNTKATTSFSIESRSPLLIASETLESQTKKVLFRQPNLKILIKNNAIYLRGNKKPFRKIHDSEIQFKAINNTPLLIDNNEYHGLIYLKLDKEKQKLSLINKIDLEDYIYSVLLSESYQIWPLEMQKLQAIVSRTYAVHQILQKRKNGKKSLYDIKRDTFHQRYNGHHNYHHLQQAVEATRNIILTYNGDVVLSMFDACCGGSIPANMKDLDFKKAPYLARHTPCNFCKNYGLYSWKRSIPIQTVIDSLRSFSPNIKRKLKNTGKLHSIKIQERDNAGIVYKIALKFSNKEVIISGKDLWASMNNKIRSQNFSLKKNKNTIEINGHGFGHQIGFCQRGARELVRRGWPLRKILTFYYPQTKLARIILTPC